MMLYYVTGLLMYTIIETSRFVAQVQQILSEDERLALFEYVALNPLSGDMIPQTDGVRKLRWKRQGMGKRGGLRVIYYNLLENGQIVMLTVYAKNEQSNIQPKQIKQLKD
ncbi:type II toxin-antitoxin system RelE/ParE family toxin [Kingella kingae]|uniref:type II toxin-antitoxin system RelE/ParE family toxin n=2 Tax=Kingella kingae TaxID=504 RepID=UPI001E4050CF|nr:type II toxin-antitoxin system RelE/ParE family toxin [Kingella kingae]